MVVKVVFKGIPVKHEYIIEFKDIKNMNTVAGVLNYINATYHVNLTPDTVKREYLIVVNNKQCDIHCKISDGDEIVIYPLVMGGNKEF